MSDIAERVGVSRATVSYVLNEREEGISIRAETRRRILEVASEMGYRRNDLARAVVTGKNFVFGFLSHTPGAEVSSRIMVGAQEEADRHNYLVKQFPFTPTTYQSAIKRCGEQRLAGALVISSFSEPIKQLLPEAVRFNMPVILLDDSPLQSWGVHVVSDSEQGVQLALEHLLQLGHRRIGFVSAQPEMPLSVERAELFRRNAATAGLPTPDDYLIWTNWETPGPIERGVRRILSAPNRPTALLCAGDKIAMVAMRTARAMGFNLPQDLSVIGFADLTMAAYADPALTTVGQSFEEIGRIGARRLIEAIESKLDYFEQVAEDVRVPTSLIVRASTAEPPHPES